MIVTNHEIISSNHVWK